MSARNLHYTFPDSQPADVMPLLLGQCQCSSSSVYVVSVAEVKADSGSGVTEGRHRQKARVLINENEGLAEVAHLAEHEVGQGMVSVRVAEEAMMGLFNGEHVFAPLASPFRQAVVIEP